MSSRVVGSCFGMFGTLLACVLRCGEWFGCVV